VGNILYIVHYIAHSTPGLTTSGMACSELSKAVLVLTVFAKSGRATNSFRRCRSPGAATCNYGNFLDLPEIHQAKRVETFLVN
jgi:hypothetical protein